MSYCLENKEVTARKTHSCYLCNLPINKGEKHISRSFVDDEGFGRIHMHILCESYTKNWNEDDWSYHDPVEFRELIQKKPVTSFEDRLFGIGDTHTGKYKITAAWWQPIVDYCKRW